MTERLTPAQSDMRTLQPKRPFTEGEIELAFIIAQRHVPADSVVLSVLSAAARDVRTLALVRAWTEEWHDQESTKRVAALLRDEEA